MSTDSQNIINSFDALPTPEQRIVVAEILRRVAQWDTPPLSDEELVQSADHVFSELDEREADSAG